MLPVIAQCEGERGDGVEIHPAFTLPLAAAVLISDLYLDFTHAMTCMSPQSLSLPWTPLPKTEGVLEGRKPTLESASFRGSLSVSARKDSAVMDQESPKPSRFLLILHLASPSP